MTYSGGNELAGMTGEGVGLSRPPVPDAAKRDQACQREQQEKAGTLQNGAVAGQIQEMKCAHHAFEEKEEYETGEHRFDRYEHWSSAVFAGPSNRIEYIANCNIMSRTKFDAPDCRRSSVREGENKSLIAMQRKTKADP
jgi:hypothetical protein